STGCVASVETISSAPDWDHAPVLMRSRVTVSGLAPLRRNSVTCSGVTDADCGLSIASSCLDTAGPRRVIVLVCVSADERDPARAELARAAALLAVQHRRIPSPRRAPQHAIPNLTR